MYYMAWSRFSGSIQSKNALLLAAQSYVKAQSPQRAAELYQLFVRRFPQGEKHEVALVELLELYVSENQVEDATELRSHKGFGGIKNAERQQKKDFLTAHIKLMQRDTAQAVSLFSKVAKADKSPSTVGEKAVQSLAHSLYHSGKFKEATDNYEILDSKYKKLDLGGLTRWASAAAQSAQMERALTLYERILNKSIEPSKKVEIQLSKAKAYSALGNIARAVETLQLVASNDSAGAAVAVALKNIADLYYGQGLYPSAVSAYRKYLLHPQNKQRDAVLFRLGEMYRLQYKRYPAALREFETLVKEFPASSFYFPATYRIALCHEMVGDYAAASREYAFIIGSQAPVDLKTDAQSRLEYVQDFKKSSLKQALIRMSDLLQGEADKVERLFQLAQIELNDLKNVERAIELYDSLLSRFEEIPEPKKPLVILQRGIAFQKLFQKAVFENDSALASYAREKALGQFEMVVSKFAGGIAADEAAFRKMKLSNPGVSEYESFVSSFPKSKHLPELLMEIASVYQKRGKKDEAHEKAKSFYHQFIGSFPSHPLSSSARIGYARASLVTGDFDAALAQLNEIPSDDITYQPEKLFLEGTIAQKRKQYPLAEQHFSQVLSHHSFSSFALESRFQLAEVLRKTGKIFKAQHNYRLVSELSTDAQLVQKAQYGLGICALSAGEREQALALFNGLLADSSAKSLIPAIHYQLGTLFSEQKQTFVAIDHFKKSLNSGRASQPSRLLSKIAELYFVSRSYAEASTYFKNAIEKSKTTGDSLVGIVGSGKSLLLGGQRKKADPYLRLFKERYAKEHSSLEAGLIYWDGLAFLGEKQYPKAVGRFDHVLERYSSSEFADDAAYHRALSLFYGGKDDEARGAFERFFSSFPQSEFYIKSQFKIAMLLHNSEQYLRAAAVFDSISVSSTTDSDTRYRALLNAAIDYQKALSWRKSAQMYQRIEQDAPSRMRPSSLFLRIGFALYQANQFEKARSYFEKAALDPSDEERPEVLYWVASSNAKMGEFQKALTDYIKVPYLHSGEGKWGVTAELEAARIYERLGQFDKAQILYRKIVKSDGERGQFGKIAVKRLAHLSTLNAD